MSGLEPFISVLSKLALEVVIEVTKKESSNVLARWLKTDLKKVVEETFSQASSKYIRNYRDRHGILKVVCARMDSPIALDDIYTPVKLIARSEMSYFESLEDLETLYRNEAREFEAFKSEKKEGIALADQEQYLMILGAPGIGKSTFLRKIGLEALNGREWNFWEAGSSYKALRGISEVERQHTCIPVFIMLKYVKSNSFSIMEAISAEFGICGFPDAEAFTHAALKQGKVLVLIDGLDEVPEDHHDHTVTEIRNLVDRYSRNRFIVSCRTAGYKGGFERFKDVTVASLEDYQIKRFIQNWFNSPDDRKLETAQKCWDLLSCSDYKSTKDLAKTPLLLTLLCAIYDRSLAFPKNRSSTYGAALDIILEEWGAEKRITRHPIYQDLSIELEKDLLAEIAVESFWKDELFFPKRKLTKRIKIFLERTLNAPKHLDGESVLRKIELQQGILVERLKYIYSFSHLTLQEYLTAQWIVDNGQVQVILDANALIDTRWREVFLLVSGLLPGRRRADRFLLDMEKKAAYLINQSQSPHLFKCVIDIARDVKGNFKPAAKRATILALLLEILFGLIDDKNENRKLMLQRAQKIAFEPSYGIDVSLSEKLRKVYDLVCERGRDFELACGQNSELQASSRRYRSAQYRDAAFARILYRDIGIASVFKEENILTKVNWERLIHRLESLRKFVSNQEISYEIRTQALATEVRKIWISEFGLPVAEFSLPVEDIYVMSNYLYINELMLRCKEAAVRASNQVWYQIENRMFLI